MQKRRYADVSFGQIHYRTAGKGPALVLLHQSPRSSAEYTELMEELSEDYTVYAPDNPGNGQSDPLPVDVPGMENYADALIEFLDAVKLESVLVYGFHTGASIATAAAARHPSRIRYAVANGLSVFRGTEKEDLLANYCPPLVPKADGSHLAWLWERFQSQARFFPWYKTSDDARIDVPPYSPERCQVMVEDFLLAGNNYIAPYNAAFMFDPVAAGMLPADNLLVMSTEADPLFKCLKLLPTKQAVYRGTSHQDCLVQAFRQLKNHR